MTLGKKIIIISASSDIGTAMCLKYIKEGWLVFGTYKTETPRINYLESLGVKLAYCNLLDRDSTQNATLELKKKCTSWDVLVLCAGTQKPVGHFLNCDFNAWEESLTIHFSRQIYIVKELLSCRNLQAGQMPAVLFFAGGGTNNATINYSAYTISKIALIKMCELLDAEIEDTKFSIVGPGWVKTKIHQETLDAGTDAGENLQKTKTKLTENTFTPMDDVLASCDWIINAPREIVGGRNFSTVFDLWGSKELEDELKNNYDMYKLRRHGNNFKNRNG